MVSKAHNIADDLVSSFFSIYVWTAIVGGRLGAPFCGYLDRETNAARTLEA